MPGIRFGRTFAFDPAAGRLWVVCGRCTRWNLTIYDERLEALAWCDRAFAAGRRLAASGAIAAVRAGAGVVLIRLGTVSAAEFAEWRYSEVSNRRRVISRIRSIALGTGAIALLWLYMSGTTQALVGNALLAAIGTACGLQAAVSVGQYRARLRSIPVLTADGTLVVVQRRDLGETELLPSSSTLGWALSVRHAAGVMRLEDAAARHALRSLLALANQDGGTRALFGAALDLLHRTRTPNGAIVSVARLSESLRGDYATRVASFHRNGTYDGAARGPHGTIPEPINQAALLNLPQSMRLALEMAVAEATETPEPAGGLRILAEAWARAEVIARIADGLLIPAEVNEQLSRLRAKVDQ